MKTVYTLGGKYNASFLPPNQWNVIEIPHLKRPGKADKADLVIFPGGGDLSPSMYSRNYPFIHSNPTRDAWEKSWFNWAKASGTAMFGICRGMQLFTALTGGELIPHVLGHHGTHEAHISKDSQFSHKKFTVNSLHHQMCVPARSSVLLAWAEEVSFPAHSSGKITQEPEAIYFPDVRALGVQWHPEMMGRGVPATDYVHYAMEKYLNV